MSQGIIAMKNAGLLSCAALCAVGLGMQAASAQAPAPSRPLEPMSREGTILKNMQGYFDRQYTERYPCAEKLNSNAWFSVDLKPACNMNLYSAAGRTCAVSFPCMPPGRPVFYGVPFQIVAPAENENRTVVALPSKLLLPDGLPASVEVPVGRKAAVLYFLVASYYTAPDGKLGFQLNYADGTQLPLPVVGTVDVGDWYHASTRINNENTRCVIIPVRPGSKTEFRNLHIIQRENPAPDKAIKSITLKGDITVDTAIMVLAVTGHPGTP